MINYSALQSKVISYPHFIVVLLIGFSLRISGVKYDNITTITAHLISIHGLEICPSD